MKSCLGKESIYGGRRMLGSRLPLYTSLPWQILTLRPADSDRMTLWNGEIKVTQSGAGHFGLGREAMPAVRSETGASHVARRNEIGLELNTRIW